MTPEAKNRLSRVALGCIIGLIIAAGVVGYDISRDRARMEDMRDMAQQNVPPAEAGGPFTLIDQNGKTVTEQVLLGKLSLINFGFTYCPDVCPSRIQDMVLGIDQLGPDAAGKVQMLFVTIDPMRDDAAQMRKYISLFSGDVTGLTGTAEQIEQIAKAYKVYYAKSEPAEDGEENHTHATSDAAGPNDYMMDHTTLIYLMGPDGKLIQTFSEGIDPAEITTALKARLSP